jgi:hypothetical protein
VAVLHQTPNVFNDLQKTKVCSPAESIGQNRGANRIQVTCTIKELARPVESRKNCGSCFLDRLQKSAFNQQHMCQGVSGESLGDEQVEAHDEREM